MRKTVIGAVVVVLGLTAAPAHADLAAVDDKSPSVVAADDVAGGVAVVRDGANLTRHTAGYSDIDARTGFAPNTHIRAASITKTFVAATVLQLVCRGQGQPRRTHRDVSTRPHPG